MNTLAILIVIAGIGHVGLLVAGAMLPFVLDWRRELQKLAPMSRHIVWVHGAFIMMTVVGFAVLSLVCARQLVDGSWLARCLAGFVGLFWLARLFIQLFLFDARPYLTSRIRRYGYHGLTVLFVYFAAVYGWVALRPGV